jgi:hypothetical protein
MTKVPDYLKEQYSEVTVLAEGVLEKGEQLFMCNDCGANGTVPNEIKHLTGCNPGDCAKWGKFHSESEA